MTALATLPAPYTADLAAYAATLDAAGITRPAEWVERTCLNPAAGTAGTVDRIVTGPWGPLPRIADLKTGSGADRLSYAVQLAIYARSTHLLSLDGETWEPMPPVDLETALIFHMPAGSGTCEIVEVDIARGWELAQLCLQIRDARKTKGLFAPHVPPAPAPTRTEWIVGRIRAIRDCGDPKGRDALAAFWPAGISRKPAEWNDADLDALDPVLAAIEVLDAVPFPPLDPTKPTPSDDYATKVAEKAARQAADDAANPLLQAIADDTFPADEATRGEVKVMVTFMGDDAKTLAATWEREAKMAGKAWTFGKTPTERIAAINAAAFACATHLDDDATRCAIEAATGWTLRPEWTTGALLGCLSHERACDVRTFAEGIAANRPDEVADLARRLTDLHNQQAQEHTNP